MLDRSHFVASVDHVNPLHIIKSERINAIERIARAFPINPNPLWRKRRKLRSTALNQPPLTGEPRTVWFALRRTIECDRFKFLQFETFKPSKSYSQGLIHVLDRFDPER